VIKRISGFRGSWTLIWILFLFARKG